uniref:Glomulin, FKBP associated protein a n=1 Tax=Callorhinchus milii TaxID=7868 RepID=A0A4W3HGS7_CALMI
MALEELQAVIQRCRGIPEAEFKAEDHGIFQTAASECLEEGHVVKLLEILQEEQNKDFVTCMGWNLVGPVVGCILKDNQETEYRENCSKILDLVVQISNPKELLVGLLEQVEEAYGEKISKSILLLLQPLQTVLLKLGHKKAYSVGLTLSTIITQLSQLPVPCTNEQRQHDTYDLCKCCMAVASFVKPFVDEVGQISESKSNPSNDQLKEELLKFCMKSLEYPLLRAHLDPLPEETEENLLRTFADEILVSLICPCKLIHQGGSEETDPLQEDIKYPMNSLACLAYLLFVQHIGIDHFPAVYRYVKYYSINATFLYLFGICIDYTNIVFELHEQCLLPVEDNSLSHEYLEIKNILGVAQDLVKVMTLCPIDHLRKWSLRIFQQYINKFDTSGKYKLFRCLLKTSQHAGVQGYIIQNIKDQVDLALKPGNKNVWFSDPHLITLLHSVLSLPEGAETDLLQNSDRIMASLNLLRYLVIRDNEWQNQTGIWTDLFWIENFLHPLRTGLNMSKAHYEAEIRTKEENKKIKGLFETQCSLTVGGKKLPKMTISMQLEVLRSAIYTFDLMESVLARIEELTDPKVKTRTGDNVVL